MPVCNLKFSMPIAAALVLTIAVPRGAPVDDHKPTVAAPAQTMPDDVHRKSGVIDPPKGIDPNVSVPLFLAPVLWRETSYVGRNSEAHSAA